MAPVRSHKTHVPNALDKQDYETLDPQCDSADARLKTNESIQQSSSGHDGQAQPFIPLAPPPANQTAASIAEAMHNQ
eukprot:4697702-Amphidinium_carterae.2